MRNKDLPVGFAIVGILIFICGITLSMRGCTDEVGCTSTLTQNGYTHIQITGPRWFGGEDMYRTSFKATNPIGKDITGYVSRGWGWTKGSTIRFD